MPDLTLTITYADSTTDVCTITDENQATWSIYQQPKTVDRNVEIMQQVKTLKAWLLSIGAKSVSLTFPVPPPTP